LAADHRESDEDDVSGLDQSGSDVINDNDKVVDAELVDNEDMYLSDKVVPAKALKRKEKMTKTNVELEVVLEMSASKSEDRPKTKVRGKVVESKSEVEIVEDLEPKPPPRKNLKAKVPIREDIKDGKIIRTSVKNIRRTMVKNKNKNKHSYRLFIIFVYLLNQFH
jgi:hypothetical protein